MDMSLYKTVRDALTFFHRGNVSTQVDVPERPGPDLSPQAVLVSHPQLHGGPMRVLLFPTFYKFTDEIERDKFLDAEAEPIS